MYKWKRVSELTLVFFVNTHFYIFRGSYDHYPYGFIHGVCSFWITAGVTWLREMDLNVSPNIFAWGHLLIMVICLLVSQWTQVLYGDVVMGAMTSQITSLTIVYPTVYLGVDQRKHQSSVSLAFVRGIHRWPVNSPHKGPVTRKMFPFDDVIM